MVSDLADKLFFVLIRGQNVSGEDVAVRTDEQDLATCSFFEDSPLPNHGMSFLSPEGKEMPAGIVEHPDFFIDSNKDTHFGQFYLIDIKIADIVPEAGS